MGYPEHLQAALGQLQEHLMQCWELSLHELRQENESLRGELAKQYEESLQVQDQQQILKSELAAVQATRAEQESQKVRELENKLEEAQQKEGQLADQLGAEAAEKSRLGQQIEELKQSHKKELNHHLQALAEENSGLRQAIEELKRAHQVEMAAQREAARQQLETEASQSSRLTLELIDLKLAHEKEITRLRGLPEPSSTSLNLPELVEEDRPANPEEELQRLAYQDQHTGLPNLNLARRYLTVELSKAEKSTVALAILQLEQWDELPGLLTQDRERQELLSQFTQRVRACTRAEDVLASGSDGEFWLIFPLASGGPLGIKTATELAQRSLSKLFEALKSPFLMEDHKLLLSFWCGVGLNQGRENLDTLIRQARLAQAAAVSKGSNQMAIFQPEMEKPARRREEIAPLLRQALNREQFSLRFLPIVELKTGQIKGVEALLRWEHPTEGTWEPAHFMDAACASGVIVGLGEWVMSCVCELSRNFRSLYWFINLSHAELMQADLARRLTRSMEAAQLNRPDYIVVECQEKDVARPGPRVAANLKEFRHWKVGLAVDDFAFETLALKGLDRRGINFLKVSPKITQDLDQLPIRNLLKGGLLAAEAAGARVILKGIENQGQLDRALESGCAWGQGHRLSSPLSWPELETRLNSRQSLL
ncbi:MAG: EAL domain-containing protein [Vulcanimicrobiota bacterium]